MQMSMMIGAMLSGSFRSTMGTAMRGIGDMDKGMQGLQSRLLDFGQAAAGLYGLNKLRVTAETEQHDLEQIGITAGMGADEVEGLRQSLRRLSAKSETNQSMDNLVKSYKTLASTGLTDRITDQRQMETILRSIGRTATAATADIDDVSRMAFTLVDTLGVAPEDLSKELDRLAFAGKKGSFEMKDMAQFFPTLGAAAREAGMTGSEGIASLGAALQVAVKGAGSSAEAANNMKNFLAKMMSPDVMKNFAERSVDVTKVIGDAMKKGENPIEAMLRQTDALLGDDQVKRKARLGALFGDMQVQDFIRPMLAGMGNYKQMKSDMLAASGTVNEDYNRIIQTGKEKSEAFANAVDKAGRSIGKALLPPLGFVLDAATPVVEWLAEMADRSPGTTAAVAMLGSGIMILPPALRLATFAARTFGLANIFAAGGVRAMGVALAANPIGAAVTVMAIGAGLIYDNWDTIKTFFLSIWDDVQPYWDSYFSFVVDGALMMTTPLRAVLAVAKATMDVLQGKGFDFATVTAVFDESAAAGKRMWDRVPKEMQRPDMGILKPGDALAASDTGGLSTAAMGNAPTGQINVALDFSNMPTGVDVSTSASGPAVGDVDSRTGYQMSGP
jgi:TP901 family phage tail tape measure protein